MLSVPMLCPDGGLSIARCEGMSGVVGAFQKTMVMAMVMVMSAGVHTHNINLIWICARITNTPKQYRLLALTSGTARAPLSINISGTARALLSITITGTAEAPIDNVEIISNSTNT